MHAKTEVEDDLAISFKKKKKITLKNIFIITFLKKYASIKHLWIAFPVLVINPLKTGKQVCENLHLIYIWNIT